jgi:hypothetical protein
MSVDDPGMLEKWRVHWSFQGVKNEKRRIREITKKLQEYHTLVMEVFKFTPSLLNELKALERLVGDKEQKQEARAELLEWSDNVKERNRLERLAIQAKRLALAGGTPMEEKRDGPPPHEVHVWRESSDSISSERKRPASEISTSESDGEDLGSEDGSEDERDRLQELQDERLEREEAERVRAFQEKEKQERYDERNGREMRRMWKEEHPGWKLVHDRHGKTIIVRDMAHASAEVAEVKEEGDKEAQRRIDEPDYNQVCELAENFEREPIVGPQVEEKVAEPEMPPLVIVMPTEAAPPAPDVVTVAQKKSGLAKMFSFMRG